MTREKVKAMLIRNLCLALLALGIIVPGTAHAVCTGGVEGQLEYETVANVYRYCDGTDWVNISAGGGGGATDIDGLSDAKNDTTTDFNLFLGNAGGSVGANDDYNVAVGATALDALNNTGGDYNTAVGYDAGTAVTTGDNNVFVGAEAGKGITTGSDTVAIGFWAGRHADTEIDNVLIGSYAGWVLAGGSSNVAVGRNAGAAMSTGNFNISIGKNAGQTALDSESSNILIGYGVDTNNTDDYINIGNAIYGDMGTTTAINTEDAAIIVDGSLTTGNIDINGNAAVKGSVTFEDYGAGGYTGTTAYNLAVDSSGNVIEEDAYDPGTWQDITSIHADVYEYSNWQCRVDSMRQVFFKGVLRPSTTISAGTTIGTLPSDCRPVTVDIGYIGLTGGAASTSFTKFFNITTGGSFVATTGMNMSFYPVTTITYVLD